jgi:hypothetical protein
MYELRTIRIDIPKIGHPWKTFFIVPEVAMFSKSHSDSQKKTIFFNYLRPPYLTKS